MSRAARQCREWIEDTFPGVRISRRACRDTAGGAVSQHSAFDTNEYDSNALDIMGGPEGMSWAENVELIDQIVKTLEPHREDWSIRLILWKTSGHYGHAHIDFWPTCVTHKWCGSSVIPRWELSDGQTTILSRDPDPENGEYYGPHEGDDLMPRQLFEGMIRALFAIGEEFTGDPQFWIDLIDYPDDEQWEADFWPAYTRQMRRQ